MNVKQIKFDWEHEFYPFPLFATTKKNLSNVFTVKKEVNGGEIMA